MVPSSDDLGFIRDCLRLAEEAFAAGEVPVGAIVVQDGQIIGTGRNRCVARKSQLAHAELEALEMAFARTGAGRLAGAVLYCSLEPCFMCAGALVHARVGRLVFGARDPKFGACGSLANLPADDRLNHRMPVIEGVLAADSAALMRRFFQRLR